MAIRPPSVETSSRNAINYQWLARLRWSASAGQLATILIGASLVPGELPLGPLLSLVAVGAFSQLALARVTRHWDTRHWNDDGERLLGGVLVADMLLLTLLLAVAGGPSNPFSVFLLVHIVLAAMLLGSKWAWTLNVLAIVSFSLLFAFHVPVPSLAMHHGGDSASAAPCVHCGASDPTSANSGSGTIDATIDDAAHAGHSQHTPAPGAPQPWNLHLLGMLLAFAAASTCIVYFGTRASAALAVRERQIEATRARLAREQQLAALGAVAAGAAHELATPLGTIAIAAAEADRALRTEPFDVTELREDTGLILLEVARCRGILDQMALKTGSDVGEQSELIKTSELVTRSLNGISDAQRVRISAGDDTELFVPPNALARAVRVLLTNALLAEPNNLVEIAVRLERETVNIEVRDKGPTLSPDALLRIGEPFHTTRDPGQGMGLGVYLARTLIETLGGQLTYSALPGVGTCARISLPVKQR